MIECTTQDWAVFLCIWKFVYETELDLVQCVIESISMFLFQNVSVNIVNASYVPVVYLLLYYRLGYEKYVIMLSVSPSTILQVGGRK